MGVVIGIDFGEKRVGTSMSDPEGRVAVAGPVLDGADQRKLVRAIAALVDEEAAETVVIGMPVNMDGSMGESAERVVRFVTRLSDVLDIPVETCDERLTSVQAERTLRYGRGGETRKGGRPGRKRGKARRGEKSDVDRIAAVLILQSFLDRRRRASQ